MAVQDINIKKDANIARECIVFPFIIASAISQADVKVRGVVPGYAFEITKVEVFAKTVTATLSVQVKIGTTSALSAAVTPVADTPTAATLSTTLANKRGSSTEAINVHYTTDGTGAFTGMTVHVWIRPLPLNGEVYAV